MNPDELVSGVTESIDLSHVQNLGLMGIVRIVALILIGMLAIRVILNVVDKMLERSKSMVSLRTYIKSVVKVLLWFLLILAAFAGGIVCGLKINTLPLPTEVRDRIYPVLESYIPGSTTPRTPEAAAVAVTPEITP